MTFLLSPGSGSELRYPENIRDWSLRRQLVRLTERFQAIFSSRVESSGMHLPGVIVRARFPFNSTFLLDQDCLWIVGDVARGMPFQREYMLQDANASRLDIERAAQNELGCDDPFVVRLPLSLVGLLDSDEADLDAALGKEVDQLIASEYLRHRELSNSFRFQPLFGDPPSRQKPDLCFVMAPWARTEIYNRIIKPVVEENGLACWRADDVARNRAIMTNIWESICESRLLIADLTGANANVFYELGIAHTVGKEVILIEERPSEGERPTRMFDTYSLNAILYDQGAIGGQDLREQLDARIKATMARLISLDNSLPGFSFPHP